MTKNQQRAVTVAQRILENHDAPPDSGDADWHLLLLAAGMNNCRAHPLAVAIRALQFAHDRAGYFTQAPASTGHRRTSHSHRGEDGERSVAPSRRFMETEPQPLRSAALLAEALV